jgi:hypothetical protein
LCLTPSLREVAPQRDAEAVLPPPCDERV